MQFEHLKAILDHAYACVEPDERLHWNVRTHSGCYRHDYAFETIPMEANGTPSTTVLLTRDGNPPLYLDLASIESLEVSCG